MKISKLMIIILLLLLSKNIEKIKNKNNYILNNIIYIINHLIISYIYCLY